MTQAERDLKMISGRDRWPRWPWLPLKRRNVAGGYDGLEIATLYASEPLQLISRSIFDLPHSKAEFEAARPRDVTAEQIIEEGWTVD